LLLSLRYFLLLLVDQWRLWRLVDLLDLDRLAVLDLLRKLLILVE
jgi:hypothetical protein